jgi:serine/threonine-protein kinase
MSPEQIDAKTIDSRSDLYSLGLVFYEMLAGAPPFHSASPRELLNMQCTAEPPELSDDARAGMPRGVEELLFQMLQKDAEARPKSAAEVVERLSPFRPAERAMRTTTAHLRSSTSPSPSPSSSTGAASPSTGAPSPSQPRASASGSSTENAPSEKPKTDTVALVERATAPREVKTWMAVAAIAVLSLVAGISVYAARMHAGNGETPVPAKVASSQSR